jgi:uncharacterized membrane protein YgcG
MTAVLTAAMILAAPAAASATASAVHTGVQDFSFDSYSADYYLARDADGHSTLRTVETFVVKFPSFDQNRGIIRAIPNDYDGVPLHTNVASVTDQSGSPVHFDASDNGGLTELALGTDEYVHGRKTYVITYSQQNVVRAFTDTGDDELYWDTNGTGFNQPFGRVTARVHIDPSIVPFLTGHNACYRGVQGSKDICDITGPTDDAITVPGGQQFTAATTALAGGENLTVAVGFTAGTFVQVPAEEKPVDPGASDQPGAVFPPFGNTPWWSSALAFLLLALSVLGSVTAIVQRAFLGQRNAKGRGIIVPQYSPPKGLNLLEAAALVGRTAFGLPAQLVSFAVRGNIRILDYPVTGAGADYTLQLIRTDGVDAQELRALTILFGEELQAGAVREVGVTNNSLAVRLKELGTTAGASVVARGFTAKPRMRNGLIIALSLIGVLILSIGITVITAMLGVLSGWMLLAIPVAFVSVFIGIGTAIRPAVLTDSGAELRDYLFGVRDYLQLAEADRFRMLQSPTGAERVDVGDRAQMVKLYEKLLPFAVLWGIEREWSKELAVYYEQEASSPDWYVSNGVFNSLVFAQSFGRLASSVTTTATPTPPPSSSWSGSGGGSFSGGSFGGGFSGGGGGGGGGGGR